MTPFPTLHLDHNNQALTKRFAYQVMRSDIRVFAKTQVPSYTIKVRKWGHDFPRWSPLLTNPLGCTLRHVHVLASSPCLPLLLGPSFFNPEVGV